MDIGSSKAEDLRIAIAGSSGMIGTQLREHLAAKGNVVIRLVRQQPDSATGDVYWRPSAGEIDAARLNGLHAVVNLAGETIYGRWTKAKKERILQSRKQATELISLSLAGLPKPPNVLVSASAVGYYGNTGDRLVDEWSEPNGGFLSEVCRVWEDSTRPAREADIRTVHLRLGLVLSSRGGVLKIMRTVFGLGLGGCFGSGNQYMSWIHIDDLVRVVERVILDESLEGPVNAVAPNPVTNRQFTIALGQVMHRPTLVRVPRLAAKLTLGEMAEELVLFGQRCEPKKLKDCGFEFKYPHLVEALRRELSR